MHSASKKFSRVEDLSSKELARILAAAPLSRLQWTPREKDAWREALRRQNPDTTFIG